MNRATSPDDFAFDPIDRYWLGSTSLVWCRDAATAGSLTWGTPNERDMHELTRALELARHPALGSGVEIFMDSRGIERVDWPPFSYLLNYVKERMTEWSQRIRKQAVVLPPGPAAPLLAGMVPMVGMTYPMKFFGDSAEAIGWLGWGPEKILAIDEAAGLMAAARSITPTVQELRAWLDRSLVGPTLESAASALRVSTRTLQRELKAASTTFTAEVHAARIRAATAMLAESDEKIEAIAHAVGCISASQLSALFRKHIGETPARYRARLAAGRTGVTKP